MRSAIVQVKGRLPDDSKKEQLRRREVLSLYRWTGDGTGLALKFGQFGQEYMVFGFQAMCTSLVEINPGWRKTKGDVRFILPFGNIMSTELANFLHI